MDQEPELILRVLEALDRRGSRRRFTGKSWLAQCPAHEDRTPSLSVSQGADGRVLLFCFAGCETRTILEALGLKFSDLFPDESPGRRGRRHSPR